MTLLQTEQRRSPWERRRAWRSLTGKGAPTPPKQWAGVPRRWTVDFTVYFTLVWGWSESHSGLNSAGSAHGHDKQRAQRTLPTPGQGALRPWGSQIWVPIPEASWTTSGSLTQDHRPLDDKLRGRHCISGSAPAPSLTVSLPVSMRSWGGGGSVCWGLMCSWVVTSVPAQGCLAMEPCPGDLGLVLDALGPCSLFLCQTPPLM